jgi:hypothetical protein
MNGSDITIRESDQPGHREIRITFPPGPLSDGTPEGCYLGYGRNCLLMTKEHFDALVDRLKVYDGSEPDVCPGCGQDTQLSRTGTRTFECHLCDWRTGENDANNA